MGRLESLQEQLLITSDPSLREALLAKHDKVLTNCTGARKR